MTAETNGSETPKLLRGVGAQLRATPNERREKEKEILSQTTLQRQANGVTSEVRTKEQGIVERQKYKETAVLTPRGAVSAVEASPLAPL